MFVHCAWCGAHLGDKEPLADPRPTSGICEGCVDQLEGGRYSSKPHLRAEACASRAIPAVRPRGRGSRRTRELPKPVTEPLSAEQTS